MPRNIANKDLSLKSLELFQICAQKGSLNAAALETGLTVSTVSHHLRNLEEHLGVELFNHARRPMVLTPRGDAFLRNVEPALLSIRKARAEATAGSPVGASYLRIGTIEDFDSDIIPALAVFLSGQMPACDFLYQTGSSHDIIKMLRDRQLDLGITASPGERLGELQDRPLLKDPFVVVSPHSEERPVSELVENTTRLPFLRFSANLMIARQIETQLRRLGVSPSHRFQCSNNQTLMAMVADGAGWTITTPLLFARARQFHGKLKIDRFPGKSFARTLAIVSTPDCSRAVIDLFDDKVRALLGAHVIGPLVKDNPWLADSFRLLD